MRKLLIIFLFGYSMNVCAQTSVYHEFPDSNAVWNFAYDNFCMSFPIGGPDHIDYSITIAGDTLISGADYKKLVTPYLQVTVSSGCLIPVTTGYQGAFREDTSAKKVFFVPPGSVAEELLYDFNWQVGDTITGWLTSIFGSTDTVISIDSVLVGSGYRKMWNINSWYDVKIIEGIGCTYGLIRPSPGNATDMPNYSLTCFNQDQTVLYPSGSTTTCELITGISSPATKSFSLYPNPAAQSFSIQTDPTLFTEVAMYDVAGKLLRRWDPLPGGYTLSGIPDGIYIVEMRQKDGPGQRMPLVVRR